MNRPFSFSKKYRSLDVFILLINMTKLQITKNVKTLLLRVWVLNDYAIYLILYCRYQPLMLCSSLQMFVLTDNDKLRDYNFKYYLYEFMLLTFKFTNSFLIVRRNHFVQTFHNVDNKESWQLIWYITNQSLITVCSMIELYFAFMFRHLI